MKLRGIVNSIILIITFSIHIPAQDWILCGLGNHSILCIAVDPSDENKVIVGVEDGGIYLSSDFGKSWLHKLGNQSITSVAIDRFNSQIIYAGGKGEILKSSDGGNNFTALSLFEGIVINTIVLDESSMKAIILGTSNGVYKSFDKGKTFQKAGLSDHEITSITINNKGVKPIIYCSTLVSGVYKSANYGLTWTSANKGLFDLNVNLILCNAVLPTNLICGTVESGLFLSDDNADSWTKSETGLALTKTYILVQVLDKKTSMIVLFATNSSCEVIKSIDFGKNWKIVGQLQTNARALSIGVSSTFPFTVYLGTDKGIYKFLEQEN